jgi:hypothetical protein
VDFTALEVVGTTAIEQVVLAKIVVVVGQEVVGIATKQKEVMPEIGMGYWC